MEQEAQTPLQIYLSFFLKIKDQEIMVLEREGLGYPEIAPEVVSVKIKTIMDYMVQSIRAGKL